jgi:acetylornithine deacetylase/succinyl-diaminopimelate desuccinylase-like protein
MMAASEKLLRELIALPSVNPAALPEGDSRAGEARVAEFLAAQAAQAGLEVELRPVFPGRPNLLARLTSSEVTRQTVLLAPHSDTVGDPAMAASLFRPTRRAGRLYGRGACDTKGSVAAMLTALTALARNGRRPAHTEIVLAVTVDEEGNQSGARALARSGFKASLAIVGEPTRLSVVTAHKGAAWLRLKTHGRAAHGSRPELGRNAVHEMAKVVDCLETDYAQQLRRRRHPLLGTASVNVGVIAGGRQANIVPALCTIEVDRRTLPGETSRGVRREVRALLRKRGLTAQVSDAKNGLLCPPLETEASLPLVRQLLDLAGQREPAGVVYFSDAAVLAHGGIPSVLFGPGDIAQAHTAGEWISLRSLERGTALLERFLRSLP